MSENNNNNMYFTKEYLEDNLKEQLLQLNIVKEISRPVQFEDVSEDAFVELLNKHDIPTSFTWIEKDGKFNDWTIQLLEKVNKNDEQSQAFYKLVDTLIFDKFCKNNPLDEPFENIGINEFDIYNMPVLSLTKKYDTCNECFLWNVPEEAINADGGKWKYRIIDKKYWENEKYLHGLSLKNCKFEIVTPENLRFEGKNYSDEYPLFFWQWIYSYSDNVDLPKRLCEKLIEGLQTNDEKTSYTGENKFKAQEFLLKIMKEKKIKPQGEVRLLSNCIAAYAETINDCHDTLTVRCENPKELDLTEIIEEIIKTIQVHTEFPEIQEWFNNIISIGDTCDTIGYVQLADKQLGLLFQKDQRKYRECIASFLTKVFNINLDKVDYTMTAIDNSQALKVSTMTLEEFQSFALEDWCTKGTEEKKRLLMEPYYYNGKYIQGYGKTCPLCGKPIITEITTMRIKSVITDGVKYDFLCCAACADLFFYCDEQPKIVGVDSLGDLSAQLTLKFSIAPNYLNETYDVSFIPRPVHRRILLDTYSKGDSKCSKI